MKRTPISRGTKPLQRTALKAAGPPALKRTKPLTARSTTAPKRAAPRTIRTLGADEAVPVGVPRAYPNAAGYVRLRWLLDDGTYVEDYEHRIVMGRPKGLDVHHLNGIRNDNRPENLVVLTKDEHTELHARLDDERRVIYGPFPGPIRHGLHGEYPQHPWEPRGAAARTKQARRLEREREYAERSQQMRAMYEEGRSTTEIGEAFGVHSSNVSRALRAAGVVMRPKVTSRGQAQRKAAQEATLKRAKQVVAARARLRCERCERSLKWEPAQDHHRRPRRMGGSSDPAIHDPSNLAHLCVPCHSWAELNREQAIKDGWILQGELAEPAEVPVRTRSGWRILPNDDSQPKPCPAPLNDDAREAWRPAA